MLHRDRQRTLDLLQVATLCRSGKGGGYAVRRGAAGAADAMNKVLCHLGHVEVDHLRHVGHVDAPGGYVCRNENAVTALGEAAQRGVALGLRAVAVNLRRRVPTANQPARYAVRAVLGAHEDEEAARLRAQQVFE